MMYDITPELRVFVPTEVSTDMVLVDELPVGDEAEGTIRIWKKGNQKFVTFGGDEPFTLNPAAVEWLKECLND